MLPDFDGSTRPRTLLNPLVPLRVGAFAGGTVWAWCANVLCFRFGCGLGDEVVCDVDVDPYDAGCCTASDSAL